MRSGCLNLVFMLVAASVATALIVLGTVLFISFVVLTLQPAEGIEAILKASVALIAAYFFARVGQSVWRDLRGTGSKGKSGAAKRQGGGSTPEDGGS